MRVPWSKLGLHLFHICIVLPFECYSMLDYYYYHLKATWSAYEATNLVSIHTLLLVGHSNTPILTMHLWCGHTDPADNSTHERIVLPTILAVGREERDHPCI